MNMELQQIVHEATRETLKRIYYAEMADKTRRGMRLKAEQGGWPHKAPLGYLNRPGRNGARIEIDVCTAPIIQRAFKLAADGETNQNIIQFIIEAGLMSRNGKLLGLPALRRILRNPFYAGFICYDGKNFMGQHEPLISPSLFQSVQSRFK